MRNIKFRARIIRNGKPSLFYQENQYLISFLRRVTMFIDLESPTPRVKEADLKEEMNAYNGGVHESYLPDALENYLDRWTGLKDKNGREIYEGDIVTGNCKADHWSVPREQKYIVTFHEGKFHLNDFDGGLGWIINWHVSSKTPNLLVIGNTHENPDLCS